MLRSILTLINSKYKIAGGEALSNFFEFNVYKQNKCVTFIQPDVTHSGGYDVCKKIIKNSCKNGL